MHYWLTSLLEKVSRRRRIIFLSFDSLMSTTSFIYLSYSILLIQKELKLQQLAKTKSKSDIQHLPMIGTLFWKIKGYLTKVFFSVSYSENWILDAKRLKTSTNTNYFIWNSYIPISPLSIKFKHDTMLCSIFPVCH